VIDLLLSVAEEPMLLAILVVGGFVVWAVERLSGTNGPATRALRAWQERELRRIRRERAVEEERRAAEQAREDARVAELESEVRWLREQLRRARTGEPEQPPDTEPLRRNSARPPVPPR
jgi:hypothetical protein